MLEEEEVHDLRVDKELKEDEECELYAGSEPVECSFQEYEHQDFLKCLIGHLLNLLLTRNP